jgi:hypothetical protein
MPDRLPCAMAILVLLFSHFCFGQQSANRGTAAMRGLRGPVRSVLTESFVYREDGEKAPALSERSVYDSEGYEMESYFYDAKGELRSQTFYVRDGQHLVNMEVIINPFSKQRLVQLLNSDGVLKETDTYDRNGILTAKTLNNSFLNSRYAWSAQDVKATGSSTRVSDGGIVTTERYADNSFTERTLKPDGTTVVHSHYRASPLEADIYGDWYQASNAENRLVEHIEDSRQGYMRGLYRYDKAGREMQTTVYDRSSKLLSETSFKYAREDANGNWIEMQIWEWVPRTSNAAELRQLTHRTITYYANGGHADH